MSPLAVSVGLVIELHKFPVFLQSLSVTMQNSHYQGHVYDTSSIFSFSDLLTLSFTESTSYRWNICPASYVATDETARSAVSLRQWEILLPRLHPALNVCHYSWFIANRFARACLQLSQGQFCICHIFLCYGVIRALVVTIVDVLKNLICIRSG